MSIRTLIPLLVSCLSLTVQAQETMEHEPQVVEHEQVAFPDSIPPGGYSGITWLGGDRYAVVSDNGRDGYFIFRITLDSVGMVTSAACADFIGSQASNPDNEDIAWFAPVSTLFISSESDTKVREFSLKGMPTGRTLHLPDVFRGTSRAYSLEALTYNAVTHRFWTTSESTLEGDGLRADPDNGARNQLRIQSFDDSLCAGAQYLYEMDPNGENRKKVATLRGIQDIRYVLYRDNYVIGGYVNRVVLNDAGQIINDNKPEAGIFVIDLENHKVNKGTILTGEEINITGIYYEDGFVYYTVARFKDDVSEAVLADVSERDFEDFTYDNLLHDIYKYDIKNNENVLLSEIDHIHNLELHGKDVYFTTKDGYYNYNISSGETVSLDIVGNVAPKDKNRFRGFTKNGNDLYFSYLNENNEVAYCLLKGSDIKELMRIPNESSFIIDCICGTSVYVNYYDHGDFCLGVMNINDLNNGIFNPRKLRRYNEENQ